MTTKERVAVVTGANRGIGLEACRQLAQKGIKVILTSRNEEKGKAACEGLRQQKLDVDYHGLDVNDEKSISKLVEDLEKEYGRCDILINNAGIFPDVKGPTDSGYPSIFNAKPETMHKAMTTNVYGPLLLCQALIPLMKKNRYGRIVNLSSGLGQLSDMGAGYPSYRTTKTAINVLTRMFAGELEVHNILVNSVCPGWVKTDMGGPEAPRTVEQGADTPVWLATLPDNGPRGKFFRDRKEIDW